MYRTRRMGMLGTSRGGGDAIAPTVITSTEVSPTDVTPIPITITFSEPVTGFVVGDITVVNGSAGNFAGSGAVYTADITPTGAAVAVDVAAGVCVDLAGNANLAATQFIITSTVGYVNKVSGISAANLIGFWTMGEPSGTVADDKSSQANDGTFSNVTLAQTGIGDGQTSAQFVPASGSFLNVYSVALNSDLNGQEGTLSIWVKLRDASVWSDGVLRYMALFRVSDANRLGLRKDAATGSMTFLYVAGNTNKSINITSQSFTGWVNFVLVWSKAGDYFKVYKSAVQQGITQTSLGTWVGSLDSASGALFGSISTTPANVFDGYEAHAALWKTPLSLADITNLNNLTDDVDYIQSAAPNTVGVSNQDFWNDFSDATMLFTDAGKTIPVASNDDPIRVAIDKFANAEDLTAPSDAVRPLWKTNIQNSLAAALWNGTDSQMEHTAWASEDFTAFFVVRNLDVSFGSHIENGSEYLVITGGSYTLPERAVIHVAAQGVMANIVNSNGWNIIELTRSGNVYTILCNGTNSETATIASTFAPTLIGQDYPGNRPEWWANCYFGERIRYNAALDAETRAKVRYWLASKWSISNVIYAPYVPI